MANNDYLTDEINEDEDDVDSDVSTPRTDQQIEDAYQNTAFRVVYQTNNFFLPQISDLIEGREVINIRPEYQRRLRWSNKKKSLLVESLLLNVPIPPIYLFESDLARYEVMDGQQRLNAIHDFLSGDFAISGMDKLSFLNGRRYNRLPPKIKRSLDRASISAIVLLQETKSDEADPFLVRRYAFERLNTGGEKLNAQEMRNSIWRSPFNELIVQLARDPFFCEAFGIPAYTAVDENEYYENPDRQKNNLYRTMGDCQLVLRFFALRKDEHISGSMRSILDRCMQRNMEATTAELAGYRSAFTSVIATCRQIFGEEIFRLKPDQNNRRRLSAALYDAIAVAMYRRLDKLGSFEVRAEEVKNDIDDLVTEQTELITARANTASSIKERIKTVGEILDRYV